MSALDRAAAEHFLFAEAALLDDGLFEDWLDLFAPDGAYWVPAARGQPDPFDHVSLFYEDRTLMDMRIRRLRHPQAHALASPIRTSHVVGNVVLAGMDGEASVIRSRFVCVEFQDDRQRVFAGAYTHRLVSGADGLRIRQKRVDLVNVEAWHEAMQVFI
jgi:ethylbenzene dioxygenase subunit beta